MNNIEHSPKGIIRVADITLAQLSRGLYRSTATAFKELVSNAYDADATVVRIDTNYPEFDFISCVDNGAGMPLGEFLRYFSEKGIGSCIKRKGKKDTTDIYGRPIIGRLGIGMLAIGQLCHSFKIESHYKDRTGKGKAYQAEIVLEDVFPFPDKEEVMRNNNKEEKEIDVGTWEYDDEIEYDEKKKGFRIYSSDIRPTFRREMKDSVARIGKKDREKISFKQSDLCSQFYNKHKSVRDCQAYLETIWELAILCSLPYYGEKEGCPINLSSFTAEERKSNEFKKTIQFIQKRQLQLLNYNFCLVFDGIGLRRHIQLPTEKNTIPKLYFIDFDEEIFGSRLKFSGYLFAQVPSFIKPIELNGVQVRLRGVGIGGYDSTFLKYYRYIPTIRNRWVSGEIFVDEGLEEALNIDRDSFNEHDEHFKKLQSFLHDKLETVFNEINVAARRTHEEKRDKTSEKIKKSIQKMVIRESRGKFRLMESNLGKDASVVEVNKEKGEIVLNTASRPLKKKKANVILQNIELAYRIAENTAETEKDRHDIFYQLLQEILDELV